MDLERAIRSGVRRRRLHAGRNLTKANVDLLEVEGRHIVLKDLSGRPWPIRRVLGPWQLDREARAYALLTGVLGVPRFLGRPDRQSIALEYVPGRELSSLRPGDLTEAFFDRLEQVVAAVHARGVAHGDLHRHDVLVGDEGEPCILDFSTSIVAGAGAGWFRAHLFSQTCEADRRSLAKLRQRFLPLTRVPIPPRRGLYRAGSLVKWLMSHLRRHRARR